MEQIRTYISLPLLHTIKHIHIFCIVKMSRVCVRFRKGSNTTMAKIKTIILKLFSEKWNEMRHWGIMKQDAINKDLRVNKNIRRVLKFMTKYALHFQAQKFNLIFDIFKNKIHLEQCLKCIWLSRSQLFPHLQKEL